jgi:hypothetical protein
MTGGGEHFVSSQWIHGVGLWSADLQGFAVVPECGSFLNAGDMLFDDALSRIGLSHFFISRSLGFAMFASGFVIRGVAVFDGD